MDRDQARGDGRPVIPALPETEVLAAIDGDDWARAQALLAGHGAAVRAAFAGNARHGQSIPGWQALLAAQRALEQELEARRDRCAALLRQATREHPAVDAYRAGARA